MKALAHLNKYFRKYRLRLLLGAAFVVISNYFKVAAIIWFGKAIDRVREADEKGAQGLGSELLYHALIIIGIAVLSGIFLFLMRQAIIVMSRLIEYDLKNEVFAHYQRLDLAFYKRNNTGDLMNRISEDVSRVRMYIGPAIMYVINTVFTFVLTIIAMLSVDVKLTLYVLLPLPVLAVSIYYVSDRINRRSNLVQEQLSKITAHAQTAFSGIRILKAYGREQFSTGEMKTESAVYRQKNLSLVKTEALFQPFMIMLIGFSTIFTIYIGGMEVIGGAITYGSIAAFVIHINNLTWPIASLGWVTSLIQRAAASQARINEFLQTEPSVKSGELSPAIKGSIQFSDVTFVYPDSGIKALDRVSFTVPAGSSVAIIGRTGSGKSTVANLICRTYDIASGELLIDNNDINKLNINNLRNSISYVPQDVFLFSDTIFNNIAFSETGTQRYTPEQVTKAAHDAGILENIERFPEGMQTMVGERGITLSGGQKQRISIARAIIRTPSILIFDDCLSAVDTETEEEILNNLKRLMQGKTTLIISHRVSTVKHADQILVFDRGRVVEKGTHAQLLGSEGAYAGLHRRQLLDERAA